jgi:hypothetical protein
LSAFYLSWLEALPGPILNRPTPQGLGGRWRHNSDWVLLAGRAGLPVAPYKEDSNALSGAFVPLVPAGTPTRTVVLLDGEVFGEEPPPAIAAACRRFAKLAETRLLGVDFRSDAGQGWTFAGVTPQPDLRIGGLPFLRRLAAVLAPQGAMS